MGFMDTLGAVYNSRPMQEIRQTLMHKFQQGLDEIGNFLNTGSAYLPWPGPGQETVHQQAERSIQVNEAVNGIMEQRAQVPPTQSEKDAGLYISADAKPIEISPNNQPVNLAPQPAREEHNAVYMSGESQNVEPVKGNSPTFHVEAVQANHNDLYMSNQPYNPAQYAQAPSQEQDRGRSR